MKLYCGIGEKRWNYHEVAPGPLACVSPIKGRSERTRTVNRVTVPDGVQVIQDSGAFSDGPQSRLSFPAAYQRQQEHAAQFGYANQITHTASYDLLIDETWQDGKRSKRRWSWQDAQSAVETTVRAAAWIAHHHDGGLIQSAQGVTPDQYTDCARRVIEYIRPECDMLGLGGWCIVGIYRSLMGSFCQTINQVIPCAAARGVQRIHIWGVIYHEAIGRLQWLCDQYGLEVSTDSVGPSIKPAFGEWGYADWRDPAYKRPDTAIRGLERARHVQATRDWLKTIRDWPSYREASSVFVPERRYFEAVQLSMF